MGTVKKNFFKGFFLLVLVFSRPYLSFAQVTIDSVQLSNTNPAAGSALSVTFTYCESQYYDSSVFFGVINQAATVQTCPAAGQTFVVDSGGTNQTDTAPGAGWNGGSPQNNGVTTCPTIQQVVWNTTVPSSLTAGATYSFIVAGNVNGIQCNALNISSQMAVSFTVALPPPSCAATVVTLGLTAAPGGLYLLDVYYSFVNSGASNLVYTLPPDVTAQSAGPNAVITAGSVSWSLGNVTVQQTGVAWAMLSVSSGTAGGTVLANAVTLNSTGCGASSSNTASVTVQEPPLSLMKSESAASLAAGTAVTYALNWDTTGQDLQYYDSYDNDAVGTTNGSITGFDGTAYTQLAAVNGDLGSWSVAVSQGNSYIIGSTAVTNSQGEPISDYPALLRSGPGVNICSGFTVQGDLQIPSAAGTFAGSGDCAMVVAVNPSQGLTMVAAISGNNTPDYFYFQKNQNYDGAIYPAPMGTNSLPLFPTAQNPNGDGQQDPIIVGNWYTVNVNVQFSGSGPITYTARLWPKGIPGDAATFVYTDPNNASDIPNNAGTISGCSCGWLQGWQAYETTGVDYFANLQVYDGGPVVNATITDPVPPGVTYLGASPAPTYGAPLGPLVWNFPGPVTDQCPVSWWGTVACPGPATDQFTVSANGIAPVTSNMVSAAVTGSCITSTPTNTPTNTVTPTPTVSCALTSATLSWASDDAGEIFINGNLANLCPDGCWTGYNNISIPLSWLNTTGDNVIAAYAYSVDNVFSGATWLLTLNYSNCTSTYVEPSNCVVDQYLFDPNSATGLPPAGSFPANWNMVGFNDSSWSAPGTIGTTLPAVAFADELIPNPSGGTVPWLWGAANWLTVNVGDAWMFREHFQVGIAPTCPPLTPTPSATPSPTSTLTPVYTPTATPTPPGLHVWPNPYNPQYAWPGNGVGLFRAYQVPSGATMSIYTVSGELVIKLGQDPNYPGGYIDWNGDNSKGVPVSAGIYYYVIQNNNSTLLSGKVLVLRE